MSLPLDTYRAFLGLPPWHFWQFADSGQGAIVPIHSTLTYEYSWQGSDAAGRADVREAINEAENKLLDYLGYRPMPAYVDFATVDSPRYYDANKTRWRDVDATGRRVAVLAPEGYVQALGVEQLTLIGTATVAGGELVYSTLFSTGFEDTFTITLPWAGTDPSQIAVYFAAADRTFGDTAVGERWRIQPVNVTISGGNVVITGRKWLVVTPVLYENPALVALDPTDPATFVTSLEVYQRTTNENGNSTTTSQALLIYETNDCGSCWGPCWCSGAPVASDPGTIGAVIARAGIRDSVLGLITPAAAAYDGTSWVSAACCGYCDPDRVRLRYLAGYPLGPDGQMDRVWQGIVAKLAAAELKRRICACRETNERLHDLQQDMALQSTTTERYQRSQRDLENPFGTRLGHIQAWKDCQDRILRRGIAA